MKTNYYVQLGSKWSVGISFEVGAVDQFMYYRRLEAPTFIMYCVGLLMVHLWVTVRGRGYSWKG